VENSLLLPPVGVWAVLSPSLADHPLRPATDRRLGEPLPHQQTNQTQAAPKASEDFHPKITCGISYSFEQLSLTLGYVPTCYSAVRRSTAESKLSLFPLDLHVLGTPPAFILSQDQTLHKNASLMRQEPTVLFSSRRALAKPKSRAALFS
jgi:hypothetical protein